MTSVKFENGEKAGELLISGRRPTWAEIDLDALASNFHTIRKLVDPKVRIMAVVKANAYGHGAIECARRLSSEGADWLGVAVPEEAIALRDAGIDVPVLSLGGFWPGQESACLRFNFVPVVYRIDMVEALDRAAATEGIVAPVHVKIDTGMGRLGVRYDEANDFAEALSAYKNVRVDGMMTHLAAADDPSHDTFTDEQTARFRNVVELFRSRGFDPKFLDLANSAGTFAHPSAWGNMVRPGGMLYGLWRDVLPPPTSDSGPTSQLAPVMSLRSRITLLKRVPKGETLGYGRTFETTRDSLIATLPIGYHDGYFRALSNKGRGIVRRTFAPVVGRVSMDITLLDVTDVPGVELGDTATLLGVDGEHSIRAEEIAQTAGTLSYEVTCGVSERVPRVYRPATIELDG